MSRPVKCQWCEEKAPKSEMEFELVGKAKPVRKYYHKHCHKDFLEDKEFKRKESEELDKLKATIEDIFGIKQLPHQAYPFLQKLRNGEQVFGKQDMGKRYKEGYEFSLIEETFRHCEDTIHYWLKAKTDFDGFMGAFRYSLSIVVDKIYFVEQRVQEQKNKKKLIEKHMERVVSEEDMFETNYQKTSTTQDDIMDFLDD